MRNQFVSREDWLTSRLANAASEHAAGRGAADWLSLAAAPTFAIMALLTGVLGGGPLDLVCSASQNASPLSGMALMYMLMSAFHSAPWLKLIAGRRPPASIPRSPDHAVSDLPRP